MHRIDGPGATQAGQFTEGDPTQGVPATTVTGAWLNALQEEVAGVIEGAGMALDKPDNAQLRAAILALIAANQEIGFETGDVKLTLATTAPAGWVMANDGTIGNAGSGATARANADTEALYTLLWTNVADGFAPVTGGRGASAADDFAAGKKIALTRMLGRALAIAGGGSGLSARSLGQYLGAETHTLSVGEMPAHDHGLSGSLYAFTDQTAGGGRYVVNGGTGSGYSNQWINNTGGGGAHNNMQPTAFLNAMVKL